MMGSAEEGGGVGAEKTQMSSLSAAGVRWRRERT